MPSLTDPRRESFAQGLARGLNLSDAAVQAGFAGHKSNASRSAKCADIKARVAELVAERAEIERKSLNIAAEHAAITHERVLVELARIAFANIEDYLLDNRIDITKTTRAQKAAIAELSEDNKGRPRIKLHDKRGALMDIAKLMGWVIERKEERHVDEFENMTDEQLEAFIKRGGRPAASEALN